MTSTSLESEACLGVQILVCGQLADFTEGSTVQTAWLSMHMGAMAQITHQSAIHARTAEKSLSSARLPS